MSSTASNDARQYLTFKLGEEVFGVDVAQVREILDYVKATKIPQTPEFMAGVINLRGSVVPVIDMRLKFSMERTERTIDTCIVVLEIFLDDEKILLGALVDSVQEVFEMEQSQIEPAPRIGTRIKNEFIRGMGKRDEKFIIILDIDKVFSIEELEVVRTSGNFNL